MEDGLFHVITEYATNKKIDNIVLQDEEYMKVQGTIEQYLAQLHELDLPKEQKALIDRLISAYNESAAYYGKVCYREGFCDCVSLLKEIKVIE